MKDTKLIFVDGMSGAGKSSTAQWISRQLSNNGVKNVWLHEEVANHPIRAGEFSYGNRQDESDMDANCDLMVARWKQLTDTISSSNHIYVMEGCMYQAIIRYFLDVHYPAEKIISYLDRAMAALAPTRPIMVFLRPDDVKKALNNVFPIRGDWWKDLILAPDYEGYFKHHPYEGDESIYAMWEYYQSLCDIQHNRYDGWKIKLDTTSGDWNDHLRSIASYVEMPVVEDETPWSPDAFNEFEGIYILEGNSGNNDLTHEIQIFHKDDHLYCRAFWPYMQLIPRCENVFEMSSFPITFRFQKVADQMVIDVEGNYDWDIVGNRLVRQVG